MDDNHFSPPPPEEDVHSEQSEPAQVRDADDNFQS